MVGCSWLLHEIAGHMVQVGILLGLLENFLGLFLQKSHLLSDHLQFVANICAGERIRLQVNKKALKFQIAENTYN